MTLLIMFLFACMRDLCLFIFYELKCLWSAVFERAERKEHLFELGPAGE